jgi:hypothetical protein
MPIELLVFELALSILLVEACNRRSSPKLSCRLLTNLVGTEEVMYLALADEVTT